MNGLKQVLVELGWLSSKVIGLDCEFAGVPQKKLSFLYLYNLDKDDVEIHPIHPKLLEQHASSSDEDALVDDMGKAIADYLSTRQSVQAVFFKSLVAETYTRVFGSRARDAKPLHAICLYSEGMPIHMIDMSSEVGGFALKETQITGRRDELLESFVLSVANQMGLSTE